MASAAYTAMQSAIELKLTKLWQDQSAKATADGEESKDPNEIIAQMAKDMSKIIADEVEAYVAKGQIIITGANITGTNGGGPVAFTPADPANITFV